VQPDQASSPIDFFWELLRTDDRDRFETLWFDFPRARRALIGEARERDLSGTVASLAGALGRSSLLNHALHTGHRALVGEALATAGTTPLMSALPPRIPGAVLVAYHERRRAGVASRNGSGPCWTNGTPNGDCPVRVYRFIPKRSKGSRWR
jgi:hypothetical protein